MDFLAQWFSNFHGLWPSFPCNWRIINTVTLEFCNITADLLNIGLCSRLPENCSVPPKGAEGPGWETLF